MDLPRSTNYNYNHATIHGMPAQNDGYANASHETDGAGNGRKIRQNRPNIWTTAHPTATETTFSYRVSSKNTIINVKCNLTFITLNRLVMRGI